MTTNLSTALAKAQAKIGSAPKTGYNPHFRSTFSTLEDLISVSREALTSEGISISQFIRMTEQGNCLVTQMRCGSEMIESTCLIVLKDGGDIQKLGSAISYLKRYMYASICGIATSENEDDGNGISEQATGSTVGVISQAQYSMLKTLLKGDVDREAKMCGYYNIENLSQLPWKHMQEAVTALKAKEA